jgi:hypothetical protein
MRSVRSLPYSIRSRSSLTILPRGPLRSPTFGWRQLEGVGRSGAGYRGWGWGMMGAGRVEQGAWPHRRAWPRPPCVLGGGRTELASERSGEARAAPAHSAAAACERRVESCVLAAAGPEPSPKRTRSPVLPAPAPLPHRNKSREVTRARDLGLEDRGSGR